MFISKISLLSKRKQPANPFLDQRAAQSRYSYGHPVPGFIFSARSGALPIPDESTLDDIPASQYHDLPIHLIADHFARVVLTPVPCESSDSFAEPLALQRIDPAARCQHPLLPDAHSNTPAPHEFGRAKDAGTVRAFLQD